MNATISRSSYIVILLLAFLLPDLSFPCVPPNKPPARFFYPSEKAEGIPITTEIWIKYLIPKADSVLILKDLILRDMNGKTVPVTVTSMAQADLTLAPRAGYMITVKPLKPLQPLKKYELLTRFPKLTCAKPDPKKLCATESYHVSLSFTTGEVKDTTPPVFRGLRVLYFREPHHSTRNDCGIFHFLPFYLEWFKATDEHSAQPLRYYIYPADKPKEPIFTVVDQEYVIGAEDCTGSSYEQDYKIREHPPGYFVRVSDLSGNLSAPSSTIKIPKRCGLEDEFPIGEPNYLYEQTKDSSSDGGVVETAPLLDKKLQDQTTPDIVLTEKTPKPKDNNSGTHQSFPGCSQIKPEGMLFSFLLFLAFVVVLRNSNSSRTRNNRSTSRHAPGLRTPYDERS